MTDGHIGFVDMVSGEQMTIEEDIAETEAKLAELKKKQSDAFPAGWETRREGTEAERELKHGYLVALVDQGYWQWGLHSPLIKEGGKTSLYALSADAEASLRQACIDTLKELGE